MSISKLKRFSHEDPFDATFVTFLNYNKKKGVYPSRDYLKIAAFDPGVVNTGCRIEKRDLNDKSITTVYQNLFKSADKKSPDHYFMIMIDHLKNIQEELNDCDYILIESQMRTNPEATRMCQHIISTILMLLSENSNAKVGEISSTMKSKIYNIKGIKGKALKKWAVEKSLNILEERKDSVGLDIIKNCKKKDDQADVILYCDAWNQILEEYKNKISS